MEPNKGAIGVFGASGVSIIYNQYVINSFVNLHKEKNKYSYGEIIALAKLSYYKKGMNYQINKVVETTSQFNIFKNYIVMEFNFLGDPSIYIKSPKKQCNKQIIPTHSDSTPVRLSPAPARRP